MLHKRWLSAALALALLLPALPTRASENRVLIVPAEVRGTSNEWPNSTEALGPEGVAAWVEEHKITGLDPNHWAAPLLLGLVGSGLLAVKDGDHLDLDAPVMLWQAAQVMMTSAKQETEGLSPQEIAVRAAELRLIPGPAPAADRSVTRLEAAYMAAQLTNFTGTVEQKADLEQVFADWEAIPAESRDMVYWVTIQNRLFVGYPDRTLRPAEPFTLAEFAAVMQRLQAWAPVPELTGG